MLDEYKLRYDNVLQLQEDLKKIDAQLAEDRRDKEYREFQFKKLDEAALRDGELEELEAEQKQLANAEDIKASMNCLLDSPLQSSQPAAVDICTQL